MAWFRHHYYCEGCEGTWLAEAELTVETEITLTSELTIDADCPFCNTRGVFPYKSEDRTLVLASARKQQPKTKRRTKVSRPSRAA